ncbi:ATP-binding cassette sub-family C member 5-like [Argopecten irradians]|uniref:ATP-binding cassette sub-family C member 5-like n=1 Tax=Argopecten irradians TaxID=31199 RepID=UPI003719586F
MVRASVNLHNNAVGKVMNAPMQFFDANPPGRIINRFSRDIENVDVFIPLTLDNLLRILILVVVSFISTVFNFPLYILMVLSAGIYLSVINVIASVSIRNFKRLENIVRSSLLSHVTTSCNGLNTITVYGQEKNFIDGCNQYSDDTTVGLLLYSACVRWMGLRMDIGGSLMAIVTTIVVLATKGSISPALSSLSLTLSINAASLIQFLARMVNETEAKFTSVERIHEYENLKIEDDEDTIQVEDKWPNQGGVVFSDVVLRYRTDMDPVLHGINFKIQPRQKVGIVGRTGAGKSSLVSALYRLADLSAGHVFIDDVNIRTVSRKTLRTNLSSIPQDPILYAGTLR